MTPIRYSLLPIYLMLIMSLVIIGISGCGGGGGDGGGTPPPGVPQNPSATEGDGSITIQWSAVTGATSYNIYWSTTPGVTKRIGRVTKATGTKIEGATSPYMHSGLTNGTTYYYVITAMGPGGESAESAEVSTTPGSDPLFGDQWHLKNTGQAGGTAGEDVNVVPVWTDGYKGDGILIAVVDDGLEIAHDDLAANIAPGLSYNYVDGSSDPTGDSSDPVYFEPSYHGTAVAGVAAARDLNNIGVRGAAPRANLVGYNLLQNLIVSNAADAMTRNGASVDISSNSWGAPDATGFLYPSNSTWRSAISTGLSIGRGGLGTIYSWAAGNGGSGIMNNGTVTGAVDNSNYDGQANNRGVIAICAVGDDGIRASYSERGANLWVCTPSMGDNLHGTTTTDRTGSEGYNAGDAPDYADPNYTNTFSGTSSATPLASGIIALILQANPNLGWRDVRLILAQTARVNNPADADWTINGAGYFINHNYGFGVIDAQAAVAAALTWTNVGPESTHTTPLSAPGLAIPDDNPVGVSDTITVSGSGITSIEWIEITFSAADHTYSGALEITLTNQTTGTQSRLAEYHICSDDQANVIDCTPYSGWVFGSARHLGESADGNWTLKVADVDPFGDTGTFQSWQLKFYGR